MDGFDSSRHLHMEPLGLVSAKKQTRARAPRSCIFDQIVVEQHRNSPN